MLTDIRSSELWSSVYEDALSGSINQDVLGYYAFPEHRDEVINLILSGEYEFKPPREFKIPKDDGTLRSILIQSDEERLFMSAITKMYYSRYQHLMSDSAVAYRKGVSVPIVLREVQKHLGESIIKIDLSKYFDSVPIEVINKIIDSLSFDDGITKVLKRFYNDNRIVRNGEFVNHYKSLCQGCAFSSILANFVLRDIDERISSYCSYYVRYSDDILIVSEDAESTLTALRSELKDIGLNLNDKKTSYYSEEVQFLGGHVTKDRIGLADKNKQKIKRTIKSIVKKHGKVGDRNAQQSVVNHINKYLYGVSSDNFITSSWWFSICTDSEDFKWVDEVCKREIRASYTGKHNYTTNLHKTSDELLMQMNWIPMVHMYNLYNMNKQLFTQACLNQCRYPVSNIYDVTEEELVNLLSESNSELYFNLIQSCVKVGKKWYRVTNATPIDEEELSNLSISYLYYFTCDNYLGYSSIETGNYELEARGYSLYNTLLLTLICHKVNTDKLYVRIGDLFILTKLFNNNN